jgi:hypothetical protein
VKHCPGCGLDLPSESFGFRNKALGVRQWQCKECLRKYSKQHYEANKPSYLAARTRTNIRLRQWFESLKDRPCADCGQSYEPWVMEFDHPDGSTKVASVSELMRQHRSAAVRVEVAKCDLVCANCHRRRTYLRYVESISDHFPSGPPAPPPRRRSTCRICGRTRGEVEFVPNRNFCRPCYNAASNRAKRAVPPLA